MRRIQACMIYSLAMLLVHTLAGCIPTMVRRTEPPPMAMSFDSMPLEAATITSAVSIQTLTPPLETTSNVRFADGVNGRSEVVMASEGFVFTDSILYAFRSAVHGQRGMVAGMIGYSDPLDRRAEFLYLAEYEKSGDAYVVHSLKLTPKYAAAPRMRLFVVARKDMPRERRIATYADFVTLLADKAIGPEVYRKSSGMAAYVIIAMGADRVAPDAELCLGVSADRTSIICYKADSRFYCYNGWPVAVLTGGMDPAGATELYAKVTFREAKGGMFAFTKLLCVHQLSGFKD
ncbi:MAG: hypothetical protein JJV98_07895 [Desulfosarcina sp.]|nr:hypothetical protein [Desulfobacterales bacterium]